MRDIRVPAGSREAIERAKRGFSAVDAFSFDTYIAAVIAGGCRHLATVGHDGMPQGVPPKFLPQDDSNIMGVDDSKEGMKIGAKRWQDTLIEIAEGFEDYAENDAGSDKFNRAFDLFRENFGSLWD